MVSRTPSISPSQRWIDGDKIPVPPADTGGLPITSLIFNLVLMSIGRGQRVAAMVLKVPRPFLCVEFELGDFFKPQAAISNITTPEGVA